VFQEWARWNESTSDTTATEQIATLEAICGHVLKLGSSDPATGVTIGILSVVLNVEGLGEWQSDILRHRHVDICWQ